MKHLNPRLTGLIGATLLAMATSVAFIAYQDRPIDPASTPTPTIPTALPPAQAPIGLRFSTIQTSQTAGTPEGLLVAGGAWFKMRQLVHNAVLVEHPKGNLLFDTGLGRNAQAQFAVNSAFHKQAFAFDGLRPALDQMEQQGLQANHIAMIIPSHMHWDHISGLADFPQAAVWVLPQERHGAEHGAAPGFLKSQFEQVAHWRDLSFNGPAYLGFEHSQDVFGDGSAVLVPLHGHTAGQVGLFLTLPSGKRYFFTGDVSWTLEGLQRGADRSWLLRNGVHIDHDEGSNHAAIMHIHRLMQTHPSLTVVPAHDENVAKGLPHFPQFQN